MNPLPKPPEKPAWVFQADRVAIAALWAYVWVHDSTDRERESYKGPAQSCVTWEGM